MYDDLAPSVQAWHARMTLDAHEDGKACGSCTEVGCPERVAAARVIASDRRRRAEARAAPAHW